jgi:hypothetical protein
MRTRGLSARHVGDDPLGRFFVGLREKIRPFLADPFPERASKSESVACRRIKVLAS